MKKKTHEEFIKELKIKKPYVRVIGLYVGNRDPIECVCGYCGYGKNGAWKSNPYNILYKTECPSCISNRRKTENQYKLELVKHNSNIELIDIFTTVNDRLWHRCLKCGDSWLVTPNNIFSENTGCPRCRESHGERSIRNYLICNQINFKSQYRFDNCRKKRPLPFDFAIFADKEKTKLKILCEFDGEFHYKPARYSKNKGKMIDKFQKIQINDNIKNEYCSNNYIRLIRIPYYEFENIEQILSEVLEINKFIEVI